MTDKDIIGDICAERVAQITQHGFNQEHDDRLRPNDWVAKLTKHVGYAADDLKAAEFRKQMVRIAAIAVAAIEYTDRNSTRVTIPDKT